MAKYLPGKFLSMELSYHINGILGVRSDNMAADCYALG
jgi:hypothetical protein